MEFEHLATENAKLGERKKQPFFCCCWNQGVLIMKVSFNACSRYNACKESQSTFTIMVFSLLSLLGK